MIKSLRRAENIEILFDNYIGYLSYISQNKPFIIPMTYFYNKEDDAIICYSGAGHKINAMRKNEWVSLQVSEIESVKKWQSVLVQGAYDEVQGSAAKQYLHLFAEGIKRIILKKEKKKTDFINEFSSKIYNEEVPIIFVIKIEKITGKERRY